jgi:hypothetical protein
MKKKKKKKETNNKKHSTDVSRIFLFVGAVLGFELRAHTCEASTLSPPFLLWVFWR